MIFGAGILFIPHIEDAFPQKRLRLVDEQLVASIDGWTIKRALWSYTRGGSTFLSERYYAIDDDVRFDAASVDEVRDWIERRAGRP